MIDIIKLIDERFEAITQARNEAIEECAQATSLNIYQIRKSLEKKKEEAENAYNTAYDEYEELNSLYELLESQGASDSDLDEVEEECDEAYDRKIKTEDIYELYADALEMIIKLEDILESIEALEGRQSPLFILWFLDGCRLKQGLYKTHFI